MGLWEAVVRKPRGIARRGRCSAWDLSRVENINGRADGGEAFIVAELRLRRSIEMLSQTGSAYQKIDQL